jgi:hypothetical protein
MAERRSTVTLEKTVAEETLAHRTLVESVGTQLEMATPGSARRKFFDELMLGSSLREAMQAAPGLDLGLNPERTAALAKAYADNRRLFETVANGASLAPLSVAANRYLAVRAVKDQDLRATLKTIGNQRHENSVFNQAQLTAISQEKSRVNTALSQVSARLGEMDRAGLRDTPEYRQALGDYKDLMAKVVPQGAAGIAIEKGVASEQAVRLLDEGREKGYDLEAMKATVAPIHQDLGVIGEARAAQGSAETGFRFAGWEKNEDVVLDPGLEAKIALQADPEHNAKFLQRRAEDGEHKSLAYYEYITMVHQAALDAPISKAPKFDASETILGAGAVQGLGQETRQEFGLVERGPMTPGNIGGGLTTPGGGVATPGGTNPGFTMGTGEAPSNMPQGNPLVITAEHADFNVHVDEAMRQHKAVQARVLVSLGFAAVQGGVSFMEASSRWAANPDGGAANFAFGNMMLGLNGVNTSVQTYFQSKDAKERTFGQLIEEQKQAQGATAKNFQAKAMGAISQLREIKPPVEILHQAEMEARQSIKPQLDKAWNQHVANHELQNYKEIFNQAAQSGNSKLVDKAVKGLNQIRECEAHGRAFSREDFLEIVGANKNPQSLQGGGEGSIMDRLNSTGSTSARDAAAHFLSIERNYLDAKRMAFEQEWLATDGQSHLLNRLAQNPAVKDAMNGSIQLQDGQQFDAHQVMEAYGAKWAIERNLIEENVRLVDKRPELAMTMRHHGLDAASLLESTYTHQSSPSSGNVRVADALRRALATREGAALMPAGWNKDGQRHIGVTDLGNGNFAAYLVGHNEGGKATEGRLILFNQSQDAAGNAAIRLAGSATVSGKEMTGFMGGMNPETLREKMVEAISTGLTKRTFQDRAFELGIPLSNLPAAEVENARRNADAQIVAFNKVLDDRSLLASMCRSISTSSTEDGFRKLATAPANSSAMEFPKPSHLAHRSPEARLQSMDVAVNEANQVVHRGIRQMQDLHGITPAAWLRRLDSNRNHGKKRREFDAARGAFDAPHVRERAKSDLFTGLMGRNSGPNDAGPVMVNAYDIG